MDSDASEVYILSFQQKKKKNQLKSSGKKNSFDSLRAAHVISYSNNFSLSFKNISCRLSFMFYTALACLRSWFAALLTV